MSETKYLRCQTKQIINIALILLCTYSFRLFFRFGPNLIWVILFFLIRAVFHLFNAETTAKDVKYASTILGIIISMIVSLDYELVQNGFLTFSVRTAVCFIGMSVFFYHALAILFARFVKAPLFPDDKKGALLPKIIPTAGLLLLFWVPYLIACFPGNVNSDAVGEIRQQLGLSPLSNHHPIIHQLMIKACLIIGSFFGPIEAGVAVYSVLQMIITALIFATCLRFLADHGVSRGLCFCVFLYYALYPIHGFYSVTMYKDVPFAGIFLLLIMMLIRELNGENLSTAKSKIRSMSGMIVLSFLFCTVRNNGYYAFILGIPLMLIPRTGHRKRLFILFVSTLLLVLGYQHLIFNVIGAGRSPAGEALSLPLQMVARTVKMEKPDLNQEDFQILHEVIPDYTVFADNYTVDNSDPIKDVRVFRSDVFSSSPMRYMKSWLHIGMRYTRTYLDAFLLHTRGYWSPNIRTTSITAEVYEPNGLGLTQNTKFAGLRYYLIDLYDKISTSSAVSVFFSIGIHTILWLFSVTLLLLKKQNYVFYPILICAVLWLTVAAAPITAFHYYYALAVTLPVFLCIALNQPYVLNHSMLF